MHKRTCTREIVTVCILLATNALALWCAHLRGVEIEQQKVVSDSYVRVVLAAMNGDARFVVGNEAFECRGGPLGRADNGIKKSRAKG